MRKNPWIQLTMLGLCLVLAPQFGCGSDDEQGDIDAVQNARLTVTPGQVTFQQVSIGEEDEAFLTLQNTGEGVLQIKRMVLKENGEDRVREISPGEWIDGSYEIQPTEIVDLSLLYKPLNAVPDTGTLVIESNDPTNPALEIPITTPMLAPELLTQKTVSFVRVPKGESDFVVNPVENVGFTPLEINDIILTGGSGAFEFSFPTLDEDGLPSDSADDSQNWPGEPLAPNGEFPIRITFTPVDEAPAEASLIFYTNDPQSPEYIVELTGNAGSPCIRLNPAESIQFGEAQIGRNTNKTIAIENCAFGTDLTVNEITLSDDGNGVFKIVEETLPAPLPDDELEIEARQQATFVLTYTPEGQNVDTGELTILNDDPAQGTLTVPIQGRGTNNQCPQPFAEARLAGTAVWKANIETIPLKTVELSSENSQDPDGSVQRQQWEILERPSGSTARLLTSDMVKNPTLFLDLAGKYVIELTVYDNNGQASCETSSVTIQATPDEDIHVQLVWDTPSDSDQGDEVGTDLDLHYLHPRGKWNDTPWDVFWQNTEPGWGGPGSDDDPSLDIDDTDGAGPENVNHDNPQSGLAYAIGVYYYAANGLGSSYATIRIFIEGELKFESRDKYLTREGIFWYVGAIRWPDKEIVQRNQIAPGFPN